MAAGSALPAVSAMFQTMFCIELLSESILMAALKSSA